MALTPRYFFLNGDAHKTLRVERGADKLTAWNFPKGSMIVYSFTDARKNLKKAFSTTEVSKMINRSPITIRQNIAWGDVVSPQIGYGIGGDKKAYRYLWDEPTILKLHDFYLTQHRGQPRKDGGITPQHLPTRLELRAMINQETVFYVRNKDGEFIPTFKAEVF